MELILACCLLSSWAVGFYFHVLLPQRKDIHQLHQENQLLSHTIVDFARQLTQTTKAPEEPE